MVRLLVVRCFKPCGGNFKPCGYCFQNIVLMNSQASQVSRGKRVTKSGGTNATPRLSNSTMSRATSNTSPTNAEPQVDQHPINHTSETSSNPNVLKGKRGKTTGKGMIEMIASNGNKRLEIVFDEELWVPNTEYTNKKFTTGIGIVVRSRAPVCYDGWHNVKPEEKETLREGLTVHFDVDIDHPKIIYYVDDKMRSAYTQFKWKLHDHFQKCGTAAQGRATLPPEDLWGTDRPIEQWHWLCDNLYTSPEYIEKCKKNSVSRKRQKKAHRGGAMPFIQHALKTCKEGRSLSFIDNWAAMYQDPEGNWVSDDARDKYEQLIHKKDKRLEELSRQAPEGTPLESVQLTARDEIPIMAETIGRKGKRVRGLGSFPRMELVTATSSTVMSSGMNLMQDKMNNLESTVGTLQSENKQLKAMLMQMMNNKGRFGRGEGNVMYNQGSLSDTEDDIDMVPNTEDDDVDRANGEGDDEETENYD